jgi:hypothetical protein
MLIVEIALLKVALPVMILLNAPALIAPPVKLILPEEDASGL